MSASSSTGEPRSARATRDRPQFLGFCRGIDDDPPMIVFLVETHAAFHALWNDKSLTRELVVTISQQPLLTSGDLYGTFPATRERSAGRIQRAEFTYTDAISNSCWQDGWIS